MRKMSFLFMVYILFFSAAAENNTGRKVFVEGGTFQMGDSFRDSELILNKYKALSDFVKALLKSEFPVHSVKIDSFYMGKCEVTVSEFRKFAEDIGYLTDAEKCGGDWVYSGHQIEKKSNASWKNPEFSQTDSHSVIFVNWFDAVRYCNWLSKSEGRQECYNEAIWMCDYTKNGYRLPTEAEWEYAAWGGNKSRGYKFSGSKNLADTVWYKQNETKTHGAGEKMENEIGLYDMSGNVYEWCNDWYQDSYYNVSPSENPRGPESGSLRVCRGGSYYSLAASCRTSFRNFFPPDARSSILGFRVILFVSGASKPAKEAVEEF